MEIPFKSVGAILVGVIVVFLSRVWERPTPSQQLQDWMLAGNRLVYKNFDIFYHVHPGVKEGSEYLVCLHGFPTLSYDWLKVRPGLEKVFHKIVFLDFLGFGDSSKPLDHKYSIMEQADIVEELLDFVGINHVHILAHDYGDTVAQELLARFNERTDRKDQDVKLVIKSVTLLNGGIFPETNFPRPMQKLMLVPYVGSLLSHLSTLFLFKRSLGDVFGPETQPTDEEFEDFYYSLILNDGNLALPLLLRYIEERRMNRERWVDALHDATVPVQVIYGPADPVNPPGFVDVFKSLVPRGKVTVLPAHIGHYPQWEDPQATLTAYYQFLRNDCKLPVPTRP